MAGFSNIGEPGYQLQPPTLSSATGSPGYTNIGISRPIRQYSPYFNPSQYQMPNQADTSPEHHMNIYMAKTGVGDTGQTKMPGYAEYGFSPEDWDHITRYLTNPLDTNNMSNYMGISNRLTNLTNTNSQFANWQPEQREAWAKDFPIRMASGFGYVPAPILQNWGLPFPYNNAPNMRQY